VITGEIAEFTYGDSVGAMGRFSGGEGDIPIHLAGVGHCGLAGLRAIIGLTGASGPSRHRRRRPVGLPKVPPRLKTVPRILGWDATPGIAMDEPETTVRASGASLVNLASGVQAWWPS
jgi:hypothetical protein